LFAVAQIAQVFFDNSALLCVVFHTASNEFGGDFERETSNLILQFADGCVLLSFDLGLCLLNQLPCFIVGS